MATTLSTAVISMLADHARPMPRLSQVISAAISNSQADAPNAMAAPVNASVRPKALRASEMSAERGHRGHVHYIELDQIVGRNYLVTVHGPINPAVDPEVALRETRARFVSPPDRKCPSI